jgi:hypothetical protein
MKRSRPDEKCYDLFCGAANFAAPSRFATSRSVCRPPIEGVAPLPACMIAASSIPRAAMPWARASWPSRPNPRKLSGPFG